MVSIAKNSRNRRYYCFTPFEFIQLIGALAGIAAYCRQYGPPLDPKGWWQRFVRAVRRFAAQHRLPQVVSNRIEPTFSSPRYLVLNATVAARSSIDSGLGIIGISPSSGNLGLAVYAPTVVNSGGDTDVSSGSPHWTEIAVHGQFRGYTDVSSGSLH